MSPSFTLEEALALAQHRAQAGELTAAAEICVRILEAIPAQPQALHLLGLAAWQQGHAARATEFLRAAVRSAPRFAVAWNDLGSMLARQGHLTAAVDACRQAIAAAPELAEAHNNLGNLHQMSGSPEEAAASYRIAVSLRPGYPEAWRNLAITLRQLDRPQEAIAALQSVLAADPDFGPASALALSQLVQLSKELCDWTEIDALTAKLIAIVEDESAAINPFVFLTLETTQHQQFLCARRWAAEHLPPIQAGTVLAGSPQHASPQVNSADESRITLGYLSADFQEHATAQLIGELFILHDRSRFHVLAFSYGRDDGSAARQRLRASVDEFFDLAGSSHAEAAARIRAAGVDILIDLKGYTTGARPEILHLRPAPIQVSYLGYPGTLGTPAADYVVVDRVVIPMDQQPNFCEQLVHLPDCYFVNDRRRPISPHIPTRLASGLPEAGFVFCCFNSAHKITAPIFDIWMRLLAATPGSVLWLLAAHPVAMENLRREAESRFPGASARIVFAPSLPNPEHLARFALADLFLDTLPYNAHTLTSDALWAGCPVVTCLGEAFPGRVAASMLTAIGLPDLVTYSHEEYEALALALAHEPARLREIRGRLAASRLNTPLFDSLRFTHHLESAFETMWRLRQAGESPRGFAVELIE